MSLGFRRTCLSLIEQDNRPGLQRLLGIDEGRSRFYPRDCPGAVPGDVITDRSIAIGKDQKIQNQSRTVRSTALKSTSFDFFF